MSNYVMDAKTFVDRVRNTTKLNTVYAYGGLGYHGTPEQKARMLKAYPVENNKVAIKAANEDTWFFDCIGFIKAILNGFTATKINPKTGRDYNYGGATFPTSGPLSAKSGASAFFNEYCTNISKDFSKIKPGCAVWLNKPANGSDSHIGIYLGDGLVGECTPKWTDGAQITACLNIGAVKGYEGRKWDYFGTIPCVDYSVLEKKETVIVNPNTVYHTVKRGETLTSIAKKYKVTVQQIVDWNSIKNPNEISVGQIFVVGMPQTYTVRSGDKLSLIAKKFGTTTLKLQLANGILNPNKIYAGQVLIIK